MSNSDQGDLCNHDYVKFFYSSAENELGGYKEFRQEIMHNGTVNYNLPTIIKSLCKVDVTYFPFDVQVCRFKFGSWMHHGFELNLSLIDDAGTNSMYESNHLHFDFSTHDYKYLI